MTAGLRVRPATSRDEAAIHRVLEVLGRPVADPPSEHQREVLAAHLRDPACHVVVAELGGEVHGMACVWVRDRMGWDSPEAWIPDLAVLDGARRRGVARALVEACAEIARVAGCHLLRLECGHHRDAAHDLYAACGFVDAGVSYQRALDGVGGVSPR